MNGLFKEAAKAFPKLSPTERQTIKPGPAVEAIASSSLITEWVKGKNLDEANSIKNTEIANHLALPPVKIHCSILAEDAIKAAIDDYKKKNKKNR